MKNKNTYKNHKKQKTKFAYVLLIPFLIGFVLFFLQPLILSFVYSINNVKLIGSSSEYVWQGFNHYYDALFINTEFRTLLFTSLQDIALNVPMILFFSLFIAVLLNNKFYGRNLSRVILFLPAIITTGVLLYVESTDYLVGMGTQALQNTEISENAVYSVNTFDLESLLLNLNLPPQLMSYLNLIMDRFYGVLISSGVQITVFLAALQSISPSLYEASSIEGATAWENFWKITLPMVSPYIFVCALYSVIDTFTNSTNGLMRFIRKVAFEEQMNYGLSSAMSWIYFIIIGAVIGLISVLFLRSKLIVYQEK